MPFKSESYRPLTSIVSYPERGSGGNNRYRGNCSPKLIEDLIAFFKPEEICDYMCGSGTTKAAAQKSGVRSHLYDLHSGFDIMNCDIPERPEFVFWHPPYWDIIKYSDVMYKASDVQQKYGYDPRKLDLSRIAEWDDFVKAMNYAMMKQFTALENGGRMAVLMGDIKKKGKLYSMISEIVKPGTLENIIIKAQHNCFSDNIEYTGKFIPILHEYVMIVRKDNPMLIPVIMAKKGIKDGSGELYHFKTHSLRHTRAMEYTEQGMPIGIIQQILGHCSLQMTLHYSKVSSDMLYKKWSETEKLDLFRPETAPPNKNYQHTEDICYENVRKNLDAVRVPFGTCFKPSKIGCKSQTQMCLECASFCSTKEDLPAYETEIKRVKAMISIAEKTERNDWIEKNNQYLENLIKMRDRILQEGIVHKNGKLREDSDD